MKLTKPQWDLLCDVANGGNAVDTYPPAKKLVELGFCVRKAVGFSDRLELTVEGREHLTKNDGKKT